MSPIRPSRAMRQDLRRGGFDPLLGYHERRRQRNALSLVAGLALAISTMIAVTVVSIGIAQAEILVAPQSGNGSLAAAFLVCSIIIGAIGGTVYGQRKQRLD